MSPATPSPQPLRQRMRWGYAIVACSLAISYALWIGSMAYFEDWYENRFMYLAKIGSHGATLLICWAFLLSTRFRAVELLFGGLDKVYRAHRRIGEGAFALIWLHPIFLAADRLPDLGRFFGFFWFSNHLAGNSGLVALALFSGLVALSLWIRLPYHRWKLTHNFFGLLLILVIFHAVVADGEIQRYPLLQAWFYAWFALALSCYLYIRIFYRFFGPLHDYRVDHVEEHDDIAEVFLRSPAERRRLRFEAGQFIYLSFETPALGTEPHPFTVSSSPEADLLRVSVKELGDYTARMTALRRGDQARVWGPYGFFGHHLFAKPDREAVLIAGGIGITPFLSMVGSKAFHQRSAKAWLFYSVVEEGNAYGRPELEQVSAELGDRFELIVHISGSDNFLTAEDIGRRIGQLAQRRYFICGPAPLMEAFRQQLAAAGVPPDCIYTEDFSIL
jgi:predicted ferric reductase